MWVFGGNAYSEKFRGSFCISAKTALQFPFAFSVSEKFRGSFRISAKTALQIWFAFSVSCSVYSQCFGFPFLRFWIRRSGALQTSIFICLHGGQRCKTL